MFKRLVNKKQFTFTFDGAQITAAEGESVAAAIIASGQYTFRKSTISQSERGPFCIMGACYECLVKHDGKTVQACMLLATPDMQITTVPVANVKTNKANSPND